MSLNKTNIEWCGKSWNPVTGCLHNCDYCYARKNGKIPPNGVEAQILRWS